MERSIATSPGALRSAVQRGDPCRITSAVEDCESPTPEDVAILLKLLRHPDSYLVMETIECLGRSGRADVMPYIWRCKGRSFDLVRVVQAEVALDLGDSGHERELRRLMFDPSGLVRQWAIGSYANLYPQCALVLLRRLLRRRSGPRERMSIHDGLYVASDGKGLDDVLAYLEHHDSDVRSIRAYSLPGLTYSNDLPHVVDVLEKRLPMEPDEYVARTIHDALRDLKARLDDEGGR